MNETTRSAPRMVNEVVGAFQRSNMDESLPMKDDVSDSNVVSSEPMSSLISRSTPSDQSKQRLEQSKERVEPSTVPGAVSAGGSAPSKEQDKVRIESAKPSSPGAFGAGPGTNFTAKKSQDENGAKDVASHPDARVAPPEAPIVSKPPAAGSAVLPTTDAAVASGQDLAGQETVNTTRREGKSRYSAAASIPGAVAMKGIGEEEKEEETDLVQPGASAVAGIGKVEEEKTGEREDSLLAEKRAAMRGRRSRNSRNSSSREEEAPVKPGVVAVKGIDEEETEESAPPKPAALASNTSGDDSMLAEKMQIAGRVNRGGRTRRAQRNAAPVSAASGGTAATASASFVAAAPPPTPLDQSTSTASVATVDPMLAEKRSIASGRPATASRREAPEQRVDTEVQAVTPSPVSQDPLGQQPVLVPESGEGGGDEPPTSSNNVEVVEEENALAEQDATTAPALVAATTSRASVASSRTARSRPADPAASNTGAQVGAVAVAGINQRDNYNDDDSDDDWMDEAEEAAVEVVPAEEVTPVADGLVEARLVEEEEVDAEILERLEAQSAAIKDRIIQEAQVADAIEPNEEDEEEEKAVKKRNWLCSSVAIGVIVGLFIILFIVLRDKGDEDDRDNDRLLLNILQQFSSAEALSDNTTYEYQAFDWLAHVDEVGVQANITADRIVIDRYMLALIYFSMGGANWTDQLNFLSNTSVCEWPPKVLEEESGYENGVRCDELGSVTYLRLDSNGLIGSLPWEMHGLAELETISLSNNDITGTITTQLGALARCKSIDLSLNQFTGSIPPQLASLNNLETLALNENNLNGTIPTVTNIEAMETLLVYRNRLTGTMPPFGLHAGLRIVRYDSNLLHGEISDSIKSLGDLQEIDFSDNLMVGQIPRPTSQQMGSLRRLYLNDNFFSGSISGSISSLESLSDLRLQYNRFTGVIPQSLSSLRRLKYGIFHHNNITGTLPNSLRSMPALVELDVEYNHLTGTVPSFLATDIDTLRILRLSFNDFTGDMNPAFCDQPTYLEKETADCGGANPQVNCSCCYECCDDVTGVCEKEALSTVCASHILNEERVGAPLGRECECSEDGTIFSCRDTMCAYCKFDLSLCYEDVAVGTITNPEDEREFNVLELEYTLGRVAHVRYVDMGSDGCEMSLNGVMCNRCTKKVCSNQLESVIVNCENAGGGAFSGCNSTTATGPFEFLAYDDRWRRVCNDPDSIGLLAARN